jgi:2-C-methyl-D-erythritol 2,4-cyclodiphosphate synthase
VGFGYDIHPLKRGRPLILGGVAIPHETGLDGHSDADVLCHAVMDALLGAAALGDIGQHFPDSDTGFQGASSLKLLKRVRDMVREAGFGIVNVDSTVVAEAPRLFPYRESMTRNLAGALCIDAGRISIKATTHEGLDSVGRKEAIAAYSVVLLEPE